MYDARAGTLWLPCKMDGNNEFVAGRNVDAETYAIAKHRVIYANLD